MYKCNTIFQYSPPKRKQWCNTSKKASQNCVEMPYLAQVISWAYGSLVYWLCACFFLEYLLYLVKTGQEV